MKTELEKLDAGEVYCFFDSQVEARKMNACQICNRFNALDETDRESQKKVLGELFGSLRENVYVKPGFMCDDGKNIHVGEDFICNYNVTILDIAPVYIGDFCMIGPNVLIATVGHPLTAEGRRKKLAQAWSVTIGNDVWIGGNSVILPKVTIGNNVIVAAGSVVTKDVPDNVMVGGNPARIIRNLETE